MKKKILGVILLIAACTLALFVLYRNSQKRQVPIVFSPKNMLAGLWENYKVQYIDTNSGRTFDYQRNDITTSEGQSYAMLRAVWQDDRQTFDKAWQWTSTTLKRPNDNLFAWQYGTTSNGSLGVLTEKGGQNSASDADTDIALALLFAYSRWGDPSYLQASKNIIRDIWDLEVVAVNGKPYMTADNLEREAARTMVINPSYFTPYAYRLFAKIDPDHDWNAVIDTSYQVLEASITSPLDATSSVNIPPDWVLIDRMTGSLLPANTGNTSSNFSYDAMRVPFRMTLDYQWYGEQRAKSVLEKMSFLSSEWQNRKAIYTTYSHSGQPLVGQEAPAIYGGTLGYFIVQQPGLSGVVYADKLQTLFNPDTNNWKEHLSYYDANWAWFGMALYNNELDNLAKNIQ